jgi:hypothetical protein
MGRIRGNSREKNHSRYFGSDEALGRNEDTLKSRFLDDSNPKVGVRIVTFSRLTGRCSAQGDKPWHYSSLKPANLKQFFQINGGSTGF